MSKVRVVDFETCIGGLIEVECVLPKRRDNWRNRYDPHNRNNRQSLPGSPSILEKRRDSPASARGQQHADPIDSVRTTARESQSAPSSAGGFDVTEELCTTPARRKAGTVAQTSKSAVNRRSPRAGRRRCCHRTGQARRHWHGKAARDIARNRGQARGRSSARSGGRAGRRGGRIRYLGESQRVRIRRTRIWGRRAAGATPGGWGPATGPWPGRIPSSPGPPGPNCSGPAPGPRFPRLALGEFLQFLLHKIDLLDSGLTTFAQLVDRNGLLFGRPFFPLALHDAERHRGEIRIVSIVMRRTVLNLPERSVHSCVFTRFKYRSAKLRTTRSCDFVRSQ